MRTAVTNTRLYSYLVTRHTGRAVRLSIEEQLSGFDRHVLAVLDLRNVPLIDFSCADEVVAKLVVRYRSDQDAGERRYFFLFRGVAEHHRGPIQGALDRQNLAVAAEGVDGEPLLLGSIDPTAASVWYELWRVGTAPLQAVAARIGLETGTAAVALHELEDRRLLIREGEWFVSFRHALRDAEGSNPPA